MSSQTSRTGLSPSPVWDALRPSSAIRTALIVSSGLINILTLTGSLFMMQVYDRVLGSQSYETLFGLAAIALFAYVLQGILDGYRGRLLVLMGEKFDAEIAPKVNAANITLVLRTANGQQEAQRNSRHVDAIRAFVTGPGPIAICDLPWLPIYLIVAFILHWSLALVIVLAAVFFMWLTWMTDRRSKEPSRSALEAGMKRAQESESILRNVEAAHSMGMRATLAERWRKVNDAHLLAQRHGTFAVSGFAITAKTSRMILQSLMLGIGAVLAIKGQISAGAIIAASIMSTRALAPIDQAIGAWRPYLAARDAYKALDDLLRRMGTEPERFELPAPKAALTVADITVAVPPALPPAGQTQAAPPGGDRIALQGIRFEAKAGEAVCVIGPSASGKSTLGRALVGIWRPRGGSIRLDGAPIEQWPSDTLGRHIGYMPQDVQLFDGTIAENIARFFPDTTDEKVLAAAKAAGFDEHVRAIGGYDRRIGPGGAHLSAGQRQRLGLARALYGDPFLVVLDEPNSNLDVSGETALMSALKSVKARGGIVIIIAHNLKVLAVTDQVVALDQGRMIAAGDRDKVLAQLKIDALAPKKPAQPPPAEQGAPPVAPASAPRQIQGPRVVLQRGGTGGA
jgi:PrtD family type I secretion system ABC transporter